MSKSKKNRKVLAGLCGFCLAAGGLSASHVALAQTQEGVQVYGLIDAYVGSLKRSDQTTSTRVVNGGGTATSYWGVRGTEDLGGSLKALFVLESFFTPDTGTQGRTTADPLFAKNAYVGLSGSYGQITMGRYTIPLLKATAATNPFGASLQLSPLMLHTWIPAYGRNVVGDSVWNNGVQYITPEIGGFQGNFLVGLGEDPNTNGKNNMSGSVSYTAGPLMLIGLAQTSKVGAGFTPAMLDQSTWMGGATYDFNAVKVFGTLYKAKTNGADIKDRTGQLGVAIPVGGLGKISASWANTKIETRGLPDVKRNTYAAGYEYSLSRRTALYGIYMLDKLSNSAYAGNVGVGMRHSF